MPLLVILGQTASGKTALAAHLAWTMRGEIISADSRQVYRGMSIGSGKDLDDYIVNGTKIPYHLIDIRNAGEQYTLFEYQSDFDKTLFEITKRGTGPILCGGSGLYLESVLGAKTLRNVPENQELRLALENFSLSELSQRLEKLRSLHNTSDILDRNRCLRAIEIAEFERKHPCPPRIPPKNLIIGLFIEAEKGCEKIWNRLNIRLENGLVEEVQELLRFLKPSNLLYYGLEYKFVTRYLIGEISKDQMKNELFKAICQFAKRQRTWFRRMEKNGHLIHWVDADLCLEKKLQLAQDIIKESR